MHEFRQGYAGNLLQAEELGALKVEHMVSFSRSGETTLLRSLAAHPHLAVVHQLLEPDRKEDMVLFRHLRGNDVRKIARDHELLAHRDDLASVSSLILKNAVWEHADPVSGFILVRNPLAVIASARTLEETPASLEKHREQIRRWGRGIDSRMLPFLQDVDTTTGFCTLITRKLVAAHASGLPIVRYEDFVSTPEIVLRRLLSHFGLEWDDRVLRAHERYEEGQLGHGKIKLWEPIHRGSLEKYTKMPKEAKSKIFSLTFPVMHLYGYDFDGERVTLREEFNDRF